MKKLLVVVDMQNDFVTGCLGTKEAQAIVTALREYVSKFDGDVVFTRDTHDESYPETQEGRRLPVTHCIKNSKGWEIIPELDTSKALKIFDKPVFGSRELAGFIADNKYDEAYFCGVCTGICVISNVILTKAFAPETRVAVLKDLCACVTPESHEAALTSMATCQADII